MSPTSISRLFVPAALVAVLYPVSTAAAQQRLPTVVAIAKADSLHAAAITMAETGNRWRDAARLHRESAALRTPEDSLGFSCLKTAASLSFVVNDLTSARSDMTRAAEQALARGDIERAAHAYADAAWVAKEQKKSREVWKLGRQAEVLASSPLLSEEQRTSILKRFVRADPQFASEQR